jgi:hypothetical protein
MKKCIAFCFLLICSSGIAIGQSNTNEVELLQSIYGMEKKAIVEGFIKLDPARSEAFWGIYDTYEADRKALGKKRVELLSDYATNYGNMSDEKMDELVQMSLKQQKDHTKLIGSTYKKIKSSVGAKEAGQFYQLETYLLSAIRVEIYESIPFIGELDGGRK